MNLKDIKLIVYDFDGVMTDNKVYLDQNSNEMVRVNRSDGLAIAIIKEMGIKQIIISTEENPVVSVRAKKLKIKCFHNIDNKKNELKRYCSNNNIDLSEVVYAGNDVNDLEAMQICGCTFCPADAHMNIKKISDYVLKSNGGDGVIREMLDFIKK